LRGGGGCVRAPECGLIAAPSRLAQHPVPPLALVAAVRIRMLYRCLRWNDHTDARAGSIHCHQGNSKKNRRTQSLDREVKARRAECEVDQKEEHGCNASVIDMENCVLR